MGRDKFEILSISPTQARQRETLAPSLKRLSPQSTPKARLWPRQDWVASWTSRGSLRDATHCDDKGGSSERTSEKRQNVMTKKADARGLQRCDNRTSPEMRHSVMTKEEVSRGLLRFDKMWWGRRQMPEDSRDATAELPQEMRYSVMTKEEVSQKKLSWDAGNVSLNVPGIREALQVCEKCLGEGVRHQRSFLEIRDVCQYRCQESQKNR